jgi:hypothetical protein
MATAKGKRTKAELVAELTYARREIADLRQRVVELEHAAAAEDPIGVQVERAAALLADQFAANVAARCTGGAPDKRRENREAVLGALRRLPRARRVVLVTLGEEDGKPGVGGVVAGTVGDPLSDMDMIHAVDRAREDNARKIVTYHGAADSVALAWRCGAKDRVRSVGEVPR